MCACCASVVDGVALLGATQLHATAQSPVSISLIVCRSPLPLSLSLLTPNLDLNQQEANAQGPELTVALLPKSGTLVLTQASDPWSLSELYHRCAAGSHSLS